MANKEAWIIDAVRTPRGIGKQGKGSLAHLHPQRVASAALKAIAERNDLNTEVKNSSNATPKIPCSEKKRSKKGTSKNDAAN